jgi:DNA-binding CsgD family transcriptional regulator
MKGDLLMSVLLESLVKEVGYRFVLTAREQEIVYMLCTGQSNDEVARKLFISDKTVKNHLSKVFIKMRMNSRSEVLAYILKLSLEKTIDETAKWPQPKKQLQVAHSV